MKKKFGSKKLKGTVLYTVISVLMVLIVFLMGTLALAATASNRAMNNYSSAQTQYTAKAAVEAIMSAMQNNVEIAQAANNVSETNPRLVVDGVTFSDASLGTVESAAIEYAGTKWVLEDDSTSDDFNKMVPKTIVKISATVSQGNENSTVAAYVLKDTNPSVNNDGDNRGFVSTGSATSGNHVSLYGGAYFGFDQLFSDPLAPPSTETYTLQDADKAIETDFQVNGNLKNDSGPLRLVIKSVGTGMTIWGNLELVKPLEIMTENARSEDYTRHHGDPFSTLYVGGDNGVNYTKVPYIYVDKNFGITCDGSTIGAENIPLNIFCGDIDIYGNGGKTIYADIYCHDAAAESEIAIGGAKSALYHWAASVVNPAGDNLPATSGNYYSKGSLKIGSQGADFGRDVKVEGNVTIQPGANVTIAGNLVVGGTLNIGGNLTVNGTIQADNVVGNVGANTVQPLRPGVVQVQYVLREGFSEEQRPAIMQEYTDFRPQPDTNPGWVIQVPAYVDGYNDVIQYLAGFNESFTLTPVADAVTGEITQYKKTAADGTETMYPVPMYTAYLDASGALVSRDIAADALYLDAAGNEVTVPKIFPAEYEKDIILGQAALPGETDVKKTKIITTVSDVLNSATSPYITLHEVPDTYKPDAEGNVINVGTANANMPGVMSCNIAGSDRKFEILNSCTLTGNLSTGGSGITIKVPTNQEIWVIIDDLHMTGGSTFIVDDTDPNFKGTLNIMMKGDLTFAGNQAYTSLITQSVADKLKNSGEYQIFTDSTLAVPGVEEIGGVSINIYDDGYNHTLSFGNSATLSANIKAPYLNMRYESQAGVDPNCTIYYNGVDIKEAKSTKLGCIGCCIVHSFYTQNNWMLLYVGKTGGGGDDGFDDALMKNWSILYYENY